VRGLLLLMLLAILLPAAPLRAQAPAGSLGVQLFLDQQPGPLKGFREGKRSAATIIESNSLYYGLSPRLSLALLETVGGLLSDPLAPAERQSAPFGPGGPPGFAAQIEWASRELRAGLGPYDRPPTLRFTDGATITLTLAQAPEGLAVQRFLAIGRSLGEWQALVERFGQVFSVYFNNELVQLPGPPGESAPVGDIVLGRPWPAGLRVVHLAYFDHAFPTVDSGDDGNGFVANYRGQSNVQYDGHDGHDYYFPDQPIGSPILAAAAGVAYARTHRGYGVVIVHPGGYETIYWHLDGFAPIFAGLIDSGQGVPVAAGDYIGTSGTTGFVRGTPHLHFEVRKDGRQIDPYGWYGPGIDPCLAYAGCGQSSWLWDASLAGQHDFTRPDSRAALADTQPPIATLALNPPADLRLYVGFDGHPLQTVGAGLPQSDAALSFVPGQRGEALSLTGSSELAFPTQGNLNPQAGTIGLWAEIPASYPQSSTGRHYLFAASASPDDPARVYSGTLALRRDLLGPGDTPQWSFWSEGPGGRDLLAVPDSLAPGWHHFAVSWQRDSGTKQLFIDGQLAASVAGASLPGEVGPLIQLGRFTYGGSPAGVAIDELLISDRQLGAEQIAALATGKPALADPPVSAGRELRIDTNAIDDGGGVVAVQLGLDGVFDAPQATYDTYAWQLPEGEGRYALAARFFDRAGNSTTITQTVVLSQPPQGAARAIASDGRGVLLRISASDAQGPVQVQISQQQDFSDAHWQPLRASRFWIWQAAREPVAYLRFRDATGLVSEPLRVAAPGRITYLPLIQTINDRR
jgi:murein DD-endopeptidase MepM/ murein hydrolase activator NlpD